MSVINASAPLPSNKLDKAATEITWAINDGNGKQALKLAVAALKSAGGDEAALNSGGSGVGVLVLKAHALLLLQAWSGADAVCALLLSHARTLQRDRHSLRLAADLVLRRRRTADAVALVDGALSSAPLLAAPELHRALLFDLFALHVRSRDLKAQHLVAKRLHALSNDAAHLRWATMSLWLQSPLHFAPASSSPAPPAALVPLKLAATLMARDVAADSFDVADWLLVYCDALELLPDYAALVATLRDARTVRLWHDAVPNERLRRLASALARARRWRAALATCHALLDADADDWLAWCTALDAAAHVADADCEPDAADAPDAATPAAVVERLLTRARDFQASKKSVRGPFLFELELQRRLDRGALPPTCCAARAWPDLLLWYFDAFGDKPCYVPDAVPFVGDRSAPWCAAFLEALEQRLEREAPCGAAVAAGDAELIRRCVRWATHWSNLGLLREEFEAAPSDEQLLARATDDMARFATSVAWALPYEHRESPQAGDTLALLAARALLRLSLRRDAGSSARLLHRVHAAALLESALRKSEHNFQFKLQLVVVHDALAAYQPVHRFRNDLELRHVQSESLSYLFYEAAIASAMWREADEVADEIVRFHTESRKHVPEYLVEAYFRNAYSRVRDLMSFDDRLRQSQQLVVTRVERAHQRLVAAGTQLAAVTAALDAALAGDAADTLVCETAEQAAALVANEDLSSVASLFLCGRTYAAFTSAAVIGVPSGERLLWLRLRWSMLCALQQALSQSAAPAADAAAALVGDLRASGVVASVASPLAQYALAAEALQLAVRVSGALAAPTPDEAALVAVAAAVAAMATRSTALCDEFVRVCAAEHAAALCDALPLLQLGATLTTRFCALAADRARRAAPPRRTKAHGKLWGVVRAAIDAVDQWRAALANGAKRVNEAMARAIVRVDESSLPTSDDGNMSRSAQLAAALGDAGAVLNAWTSVRASHSMTLTTLASIFHETARGAAETLAPSQ